MGQIRKKKHLLLFDAPYEHQREMIFLKGTNGTLPFGKVKIDQRTRQ
jgi:hypothetical protein